MSYPQQKASQEVIEGQEIFRLKTPVITSGDIYEMDVPAKAFAIGPESDISRAKISYYDPTQPSRVSNFIVSTDRPFFGRVDSFGSEIYPVGRTPARILISIEEIVNNEIDLGWIGPNDGYLTFYKPILDVLAYISNPQGDPPTRSDRVYRGRIGFQASATPRNSIVLIPMYGRRYLSVTAGRFFTPATNARFTLIGLNLLTEGYETGGGDPVPVLGQYITAAAGTAIPHAPSSAIFEGETLEYRASQTGLFDYILVDFQIDSGAAIDPTDVQDNIYYIARSTDQEV